MPRELFGGVVHQAAHGRIGAAHDALHAVHRAEIVALVDALAAACADEHVLVVVRHADDLVRDHLAQRKDQVETAIHQQPVHLRGPGEVELSFGLFADERGRHFAQRHQSVAPVVDVEQRARHVAEHRFELRFGHRRVCAERRQHGGEPFAVILIRQPRQLAGARVEAREVGRNAQHTPPFAERVEKAEEQLLQFVGRELGGGGSGRGIKAHRRLRSST